MTTTASAVPVRGGSVKRRVWEHGGHRREAWGFSIMVNGKQVRRSGWATKAEASDALDAFKEELANPKPVATAPAPAQLTFGDACDRYLGTRSSRGKARSYED